MGIWLKDLTLALTTKTGSGEVVRLTYVEGLRQACSNRSFILLVLSAGMVSGVAAGWQSLLNQILHFYSDSTVGWLGFANGVSGNIGAVLVGAVSDNLFRRRFKCVILVCLCSEFIMMAYFTLSLPIHNAKQAILPHSFATLAVPIAIIGAAQSGVSPVMYELCAELTFPVPEGTSAGLLAFLWNLSSFCMIFISPVINPNDINAIATATVVLCIAMVCGVKEVYQRPQNMDDNDRSSRSASRLNI